jgi:hypothetical protein
MKMALFLEASQPDGKVYRFGFGAFVPLELVSMILLLARLF